MHTNIAFRSRRPYRGRVIALHCSGGSAGQWTNLAESLGGNYELTAPEHYGTESAGPWAGEHAFSLADEAVRSIALIDACTTGKVHLVGHSYGGGVALNVALARPERIASMALYEPSAFHLLRQLGERGAQPHTEITNVAKSVCRGVVTGDYRNAVAGFVDYWNGPGSWSALRPSIQSALIRWVPKAPLDFHALIDDPTPADAYRLLTFPVLILRGELGPLPTRTIAEGLAELLPAGRIVDIAGAGHMGPLTHTREVSAHIVRHIAEADASAERQTWWLRQRNAPSKIPATWQPLEVAS